MAAQEYGVLTIEDGDGNTLSITADYFFQNLRFSVNDSAEVVVGSGLDLGALADFIEANCE